MSYLKTASDGMFKHTKGWMIFQMQGRDVGFYQQMKNNDSQKADELY
jgi:hypothetical protein